MHLLYHKANYRAIVCTVALCFAFIPLRAQQITNFFNRVIYPNDYYFSLPMYNPAFTGDETQPSVSVTGRMQQSPQEVNPYTIQAMAQGFAPSLKSGFGFALQYHKFDDSFYGGTQLYPTNKRLLNIGLMYSYMFEVGEISILKLGLGASLLHFKSDETYIVQFPAPQPSVLLNERTFKPAFDVGLSANILDFYVGVSVKYFNEPKFKFFEPGTENVFYRNAYIVAGYKWALLQNRLIIRPSVMVNALTRSNNFGNTGGGAFFDASLLFSYKDITFAGTSYKVNDDPFFLSFLAGVRLKKTSQFTFSYHLPKNSATKGYTRFEAGISFFLQQSRFEEPDENEEVE